MDSKQDNLETRTTDDPSTEEIRKDIRGTRRNMDETLDELGERLHPRHLLDDVIEVFRGSPKGNETRDQLAQTSKRVGRTIASELKEHPLPALLVGAGVLWWIIDANSDDADTDRAVRERRERMRIAPDAAGSMGGYPGSSQAYSGYEGTESYGSGTLGATAGGMGAESYRPRSTGGSEGGTGGGLTEKASGMASAAGEKVSDAASAVGDKISDAASAVGDKFSDVGSAARRYSESGTRAVSRQADVMQDRFREASNEYPLAVGGAFLAAGLLAGLLLPRTRTEDEWMGEASDELKDSTREKAGELAEAGKEAAVKTAGAALQEAEARGITPDNLADKAGRVLSEAVKAGKETAQQEGIGGSNVKEDLQAIGRATADTAKKEGEAAAGKTTGNPGQ
jgi:hypothetical protein